MPLPRKKVCCHCREARTRCSLDIPKCKRCRSRNLECNYSEARVSRQGEEQSFWSRAAKLPTFFAEPDPESFESVTGSEKVLRNTIRRENGAERSEECMIGTRLNGESWASSIITGSTLQSAVEPPTNDPIFPNDSRHNAWLDDFSCPVSTELGLDLQELPTQQCSSSNIEGSDDFLQMSGWISPQNSSRIESPWSSIWAVANAPSSRPLLFTQRKPSSVSQSLAYNHVSHFH